jgi:hypothetical protein
MEEGSQPEEQHDMAAEVPLHQMLYHVGRLVGATIGQGTSVTMKIHLLSPRISSMCADVPRGFEKFKQRQ